MHKLLQEFPERFETERLLIRRFEKGDGLAMLDLFERNNNRELLRDEVEETNRIKKQTDAEIQVRTHHAEWIARKRMVMGIWLKKKNLYIGQIWIEPKNWNVPSFELGYYLDSGYQGKGFATEAAWNATSFLFDEIHAHRVIIITKDTNIRSQKVAERLGFLQEGHLRECSVKDGKRWGLCYYAMLQDEYIERARNKKNH